MVQNSKRKTISKKLTTFIITIFAALCKFNSIIHTDLTKALNCFALMHLNNTESRTLNKSKSCENKITTFVKIKKRNLADQIWHKARCKFKFLFLFLFLQILSNQTKHKLNLHSTLIQTKNKIQSKTITITIRNFKFTKPQHRSTVTRRKIRNQPHLDRRACRIHQHLRETQKENKTK